MPGTTFKCKTCNKNGFASLGQLRKHYSDAGHPTKYTRRVKPEPEPEIIADRERTLLDAAAALFDGEIQIEELEQAAYDRVIAYLGSRYGSPVEAAA